jgi:hypothetical protein
MPHYRLYCLDGTGKFTQVHEIAASDDVEALSHARAVKLTVKCELWERGRKVAVLTPHKARR